MAQNDTATAEEQTEDHPAADVETIVVDPDDIVEMMRRNDRDRNENRSHSLRITPPFEGELRATHHVSQQGEYYPPETDPKPIHLDEAEFLGGHSKDRGGIPGECRFPSRNDSKARFRDEYGYKADDGAYRELTEEEQAEWDEWWAAELAVWEETVRDSLVEEVVLAELYGIGDNRQTTVQIRYEEDE